MSDKILNQSLLNDPFVLVELGKLYRNSYIKSVIMNEYNYYNT